MGFLREAQPGPVQLNPWLIFGQLGVGVLDLLGQLGWVSSISVLGVGALDLSSSIFSIFFCLTLISLQALTSDLTSG